MAAEVNSNPTAQDDQIAGEHASTVYIPPAALLANDTDIDGDTIRGVSLQNAMNGTVHWDGQQVIFEPADGYTGPASFEYTITDDQGGCDSATVNLNIVANVAPVAGDDSVEGYAHTDVSMANAWLLKNDADPNGDALTIVSTQNAVNGEVSLTGNKVSFTPAENATEQASFQYSIHDGHQNYHFAQVDLSVQADGNFVGTEGNDIMVANAEDNTINANAGDDIVIGGAGDDVLTGGLGADVFVWSIDDTTSGEVAVDRVTDFDLAEDKLDLKDLLNREFLDVNYPYITEEQLDSFLDFNVVEGSTEISIRDTLEGDTVQKIVLENVLLPETPSPLLPLSHDANLLIEFRENLIFT